MTIIITILIILVFMAIVYNNFVYILSVSCQIVGSIALLVHAIPIRKRDFVRTFFVNSFSEREGDDIRYNHELFVNKCRKTYLTFLSVSCLLCGFVLQIFGDKNNDEPIILFIAITICTMIIYGAIYFISFLLARWIWEKPITGKELDKYDIDTNIKIATEKEIIDMLDETLEEVMGEKPLTSQNKSN